MDAFTRAYIAALLWSELDDTTGEHFDEHYDASNLSPSALESITTDCSVFQRHNADLLERAGDDVQNGHDFLLTRNRHGSGFWDHDYDASVSGLLTADAHRYAETNLFCGDDGQLYVSP